MTNRHSEFWEGRAAILRRRLAEADDSAQRELLERCLETALEAVREELIDDAAKVHTEAGSRRNDGLGES